MFGWKWVFCMWMIIAGCLLVEGTNLVGISLQHNTKIERDASEASQYIYHVPAITSPVYIIGSTCVVIKSLALDFDLEFQEKIQNFGKDSFFWQQTMKVLSWWNHEEPNQIRGHEETHCFSPYKQMYFGLKVLGTRKDRIEIMFEHRALNFTCCLCLILGLLLFYNAPRLSKSMAFYYTSGTGLGILASALILVFVLSRFLPKKPAAYTVLLGGWSVCAWVISKLWSNLSEVLIFYYQYVIAYVFISGFISFGLCYRYGTVSDPRSHNLIQWTIQLFSVFLLYNGTQAPKVSLVIIMGILSHWWLTGEIRKRFKINFSMPRFTKMDFLKSVPVLKRFQKLPERKYLTEEEFEQEGRIETEKALAELRKFCNSPECSPWKTISRIESPKRFAHFIEEGSHILEEEFSIHEDTLANIPETDDEEDFNGDYTFFSDDEDNPEDFHYGDMNEDMEEG